MPVWDDEFYHRAYELTRAGFTDAAAGRRLGYTPEGWRRECSRRKALRSALKRGREASRKSPAPEKNAVVAHALGRLPEDLRTLWHDLFGHAEDFVWSDAVPTIEHVERVLANRGKFARQCLFAHALARTNFNPERAKRMLNVSADTLKHWNADPAFRRLIAHVEEAKDDMLEGLFLDAAAAGSEACILHAVKTRLARRGYNSTANVKHEHTGVLGHMLVAVEVDDDPGVPVREMTLDQKRRMLEGVRAKRAAGDIDAADAEKLLEPKE